MTSPGSFSSTPLRLPVWAQVIIGLVLVTLIGFILASSAYVSAWDEEDSNFYEAATLALQMRGIHPAGATAFVFWNEDCASCEKAIRSFQTSSRSLRIYGVHTSDPTSSESELRSLWRQWAPPATNLLIDEDQFLQTSFRVRSFPTVFLFLPKNKKIYSYLGDIDDNRQRMKELLATEWFRPSE